jgi:hypothetical protein
LISEKLKGDLLRAEKAQLKLFRYEYKPCKHLVPNISFKGRKNAILLGGSNVQNDSFNKFKSDLKFKQEMLDYLTKHKR